MFLNEIASVSAGSKKLLLIYVIHEIILSTFNKGDEFIKAFGGYLKLYVDQIKYTAITEPHKRHRRDPRLHRYFESLGKAELLHAEFHQKDEGPADKEARNVRSSQRRLKMDPKEREAAARATKNILKEYQTLMENDNSRRIFTLRLEEQEAQKRLNNIKHLFEADAPEPKEDLSSKLASLEIKSQRLEKLEELQELERIYSRVTKELVEILATVPEESQPIFEELKTFNTDVGCC